jgi:hypothetical protein
VNSASTAPGGSGRWNPAAAVIQADLREPEAILAAPETQLLIDFSQPVAVLLVAVLHFIPDEAGPWQIVATLRDALAPGSYLVLVHGTSESRPDIHDAFETAYTSRVAASLFLRQRPDIQRFFDGFSLIDPGLVYLPEWRPDSSEDVPEDPRKFWGLVGVGRRDAAPAPGAQP